jgi:hypothetical protein
LENFLKIKKGKINKIEQNSNPPQKIFLSLLFFLFFVFFLGGGGSVGVVVVRLYFSVRSTGGIVSVPWRPSPDADVFFLAHPHTLLTLLPLALWEMNIPSANR